MEQNTALTVAVILVAIAVLMQAGSMLGIWLTLRKIPGQIESVRAERQAASRSSDAVRARDRQQLARAFAKDYREPL